MFDLVIDIIVQAIPAMIPSLAAWTGKRFLAWYRRPHAAEARAVQFSDIGWP